MKTGVLIINLGTPDECNVKSVRQYLRQFLNDPRVIDIAPVLRWMLLNLIILPFRPKKSLEAYQKVWTSEGSPIKVITRSVKHKLQDLLGDDYQVEFGMRYASPSIESALEKLKNCAKIIIIPQYPQYSSAATGSSLEETFKVMSKSWNWPDLKVISSFYNHPDFIKAQGELIKRHHQQVQSDFILFSYHGVPVRHVKKSSCHQSCDQVAPCPPVSLTNQFCYRAQCYATTKALAEYLELAPSFYTSSFQSRLGRTPWIKPYTDEILEKLIQRGVRRLTVVCPSFVSDCLETLEEIGIRAREDWLSLGGEHLELIPCVNDSDLYISFLNDIVREKSRQKLDQSIISKHLSGFSSNHIASI